MTSPSAELEVFQQSVGRWQDVTFPRKTRQSIVAHLKREVQELEQKHTPDEAADCFLLLLGHANHCGYSLWDAVREKFALVQLRRWGTPDADGVVEHIRSEP